jgi:hypothetical protein
MHLLKKNPFKTDSRVRKRAIIFVVAFATIGTILLLLTRAATPTAHFETESANLSGNATIVSDTQASGGQALQFNAPTTPPPSGSSRCPAFPAFPDANCTGTLPNITRTNSGSITTSQPGQVIQNVNVTGSIQVNHDNVIIRNVRVSQPGGVAIAITPGATGTLIEDCELNGTGSPTSDEAVQYTNYTIRRCNIYGFGEGPRMNGNVTIEDNYMHDFVDYSHLDAHQDGVQTTSGSNMTVRHNTIIMDVENGNAAIMIGTAQGADDNVFTAVQLRATQRMRPASGLLTTTLAR